MWKRRNHLKPILDALEGRQPEKDAVRTIAVYSVIPSAIVGLLVGAFSVPANAPNEQLLLATIGGVLAGAVLSITFIVLLHRFVGFGSVAMLTYSVLGAMMGFVIGAAIWRESNFWPPAIVAIIGAILLPIMGWRRRIPPQEPPNPFDDRSATN
jgi:MFS family permease